MRLAVVIASLWLVTFPSLADAAEKIAFVPEPSWVKPVPLDPAPRPDSAAAHGGVDARLLDIQVNRTLASPEAYFHHAVQAVNERGVPDVSEFSCSFNPAYETLLMHRIVIHRGGQDIRVPLAGHVKLLHREARLEDQIYDGELTAVLLIDDVRPGDVVESSYTLRGANPVLAGHYASQWYTKSSTPLALLHRRMLWPVGRPLRVERGNDVPAPTVTRTGDTVEYELLRRRVPVIEYDDAVPSWHDALGSVRFSDATSWNEVARWAKSLFQDPPAFSPALRAKIAEIERSVDTPEGRAMAAIRFVQDDIRYLGIEIGENSHRAADPNLVLTRRFGDCKDKALLLSILLRALGYESQPALVNTYERDSTAALGPNALGFDHAIVRLKNRSSGATWWIDATDSGQRGSDLSKLVLPTFGMALVVAETTQALSRIEGKAPQTLTTIEKRILANRPDALPTLDVTTTYFGFDANAVRRKIRGSGRDQVVKTFLDFYRQHYPGVETARALEIDDDEAANRVKITEHYAIRSFWEHGEGTDSTCEFSAFELQGELPSEPGKQRTMPFGLPIPHKVVYLASLELEQKVDFEKNDKQLDLPGIRMHSRETPSEHGMEKYLEMEFTGGSWTPAQAIDASPKLEMMKELLYFRVDHSGKGEATSSEGEGTGGIDPIAILLAIMGLILGTVVAVMIYRAPAPATLWTKQDFAPNSQPWVPDQPIGGWLYLLGFGLVLSPFLILVQMGILLSTTPAAPIVTPKGGLTSHAILLMGVAGSAIQFVGTILLVVLFLQRRRKFFRTYVGYFLVILAFLTAIPIAAFTVHADPLELTKELASGPIRTAITFVLWWTYFVRSRRVEATFVH